jgi:polyamine oxidase
MAIHHLWLLFCVQLSLCYPTGAEDVRAKVLILGGGLTGLQISQVLNDNNMKDFLILEADSKLGGRFLAIDLPDLPATLSFLHVDKRENAPDIVRELLDRCGLNHSSSDYFQFTAIDENGNSVTEEAKATERRLFQAINDLMVAWRRGDFEGKDDLSLQGALRIYGWHPKTSLDWAIEYFWFQLDYVQHPSAISMKRWLSLHAAGGLYENLDYHVIRNSYFGNRKIIECMKSSASLTDDDPRVRLETMVTEIQYSDSGVTAITSDGSRYTGEYAVVTFSLGVLQQQQQLKFTPQFPFWKILAINRFIMAPETYIYIYFNQTIHLPRSLGTYIYVSDVRGMYHSQTEIVSDIERKYPHSQSYSLFEFWLVGEDALRAEMQVSHETERELIDIYRKWFGPTTPEPTYVKVCNFSTNPLYYGGTAQVPLGATRKDSDDLRRPLGKRLFFAGDAYQDNVFARAALLSGDETAFVMLECMNGGSCDMPQLATETPTSCPSGASGRYLVHGLLVVLLAMTA